MRGRIIIVLDKKKGFTLIELLISIVILTLIVLFMSTLFETSYKTSAMVTEKADQKKYEKRVLNLLYYDLIESKSIQPTRVSKNYDTVDFTNSFSLHGIENPNVKWAVLEDGKGVDSLVRAEAIGTFSLNNSTNYYLDVIGEGVESFKISISGDFAEIYLKFKAQKPLHLKLYVGGKESSSEDEDVK